MSAQVFYGNTLHPDQVKASLGAGAGAGQGAGLGSAVPPASGGTGSSAANQRVMVRRVTRRYSYVSPSVSCGALLTQSGSPVRGPLARSH